MVDSGTNLVLITLFTILLGKLEGNDFLRHLRLLHSTGEHHRGTAVGTKACTGKIRTLYLRPALGASKYLGIVVLLYHSFNGLILIVGIKNGVALLTFQALCFDIKE